MTHKTKYKYLLSLAILCLLFLSGQFYLSDTSSADSITHSEQQTMPNLNGDKAEEYLKEQGLYQSLSAAMQAAKYSIYPTKNHPVKNQENVLGASNPRQGYSTYFSADGVQLVSSAKNNKWKIGMNLESIGHGDDLAKINSGKMQVQKNKSRIEIEKYYKGQGTRDEGQGKTEIQNPKPKITEWYNNTSSGLEQGWTISEKLSDTVEELELVLAIESDLQPKLASNQQAVDFVRANDKQVVRYDKLKSWDANGKELASRMELANDQLSIIVDDSEAKYPITVDPFFTQTQKLTASDAAAGDQFGESVAISGDTAIVGAVLNDDAGTNSGSAYIFERNTNGADMWGEVAKLTASDAAAFDQFGVSVAISGDTAIVGANGNDDAGGNSGSAYIFERNTNGVDMWGEVAKLTASDAAFNDQFGISVAISGDTAIVGARLNNDAGSFSGSAYIFGRNTNGVDMWGEVTKLTASDAAAGDQFGGSVAISGDTAIVGARLNDAAGTDSGSAYIFERNTNGADMWGEVTKLTASDAAAGDQFGISVAISGDTAIVGAYFNDDAGTDSGSAYIFERNTNGVDMWGEVQELTASDAANSDQFGFSVAISGDTAIVGADRNDDAANDSGSAYIYTNQFNNWREVSSPLASDGTAGDQFGISVAISGDTAIVGANANDDAGSFSGSAYIFERNTAGADMWGEVAKLTASDAAAGDFFGISVAISGDTAIVGANSDDDAGSLSGSAYIFERNTNGADMWGEVAKLTASDAATGDRFGTSVAISGDTAIVGANLNDDAGSFSGSAYIFERNMNGANMWGEVTKMTASDAAFNDQFGFSVAISGDTAIVGAAQNDDAGSESGSAYIFERNTNGVDMWGEVTKLTALDAATSDQFGISVAISGDTAIVGAYRNDDAVSDSGSAYIFERNTNGADMWGEVAKLTASDAAASDEFGFSVAISGDNAIVGAAQNDDNATNTGSAYIFERNTNGANMWGEVAKLNASDATAGDNFGISVAISGDTAIVGAYLKDVPVPLTGKRSASRKDSLSKFGKNNAPNLAGVDQGGAYIFKALAPLTAAPASISGRVLSPNGRAIPYASVILTDQNGETRTARTNSFGYFHFADIEVGQTLVLNAYHKSYQFNSQVINLDDSITDLMIVAQ